MEFFAAEKDSRKLAVDAVLLPFFEHKKGPQPAMDASGYKSDLTFMRDLKEFSAKEGQTLLLYSREGMHKRLLLVGLGKEESLSLETIRRAFAAGFKEARAKKLSILTVVLPQLEALSAEVVAACCTEALFFVNYRIDTLKSKSEEESAPIQKITFLTSNPYKVLAAVNRTKVIMEATTLARDLANGNADAVTPEYLAATAKKIAKKHRALQCHTYNKAWIERQKMGLLLAVSRAAFHEPTVIVLNYRGNPSSKDRTLLVGKGVTYDTGGLHLKPMGGMETMKADMAGAAAVLATMQAIAALKLPVNVCAVVAACENCIGSKAYKPGDVYTSMSGKTVEIGSTDAEGRLVLADALTYAVKEFSPSRVIDIATLTGAAEVALGSETSALFANSDPLAELLLYSGLRTFERLWRMPLYDEYKDCLKSDIADMKNYGGRTGGAIFGALFVQEFVGTVPWAHIDIAGTAFLKEAKRYLSKYATGIGVRLFIDFFEALVERSNGKGRTTSTR